MNKGVGRATNTYTQKKKNSREEPESWKYEQDCGADQSLGDAQGGSGRRRKQQTNTHTHTQTQGLYEGISEGCEKKKKRAQ